MSHLRIVRGNPTDEEVAALVAVVATLGSGEESSPEPRSAWSERRVLVRQPLAHGPGAWRASAFPR